MVLLLLTPIEVSKAVDANKLIIEMEMMKPRLFKSDIRDGKLCYIFFIT